MDLPIIVIGHFAGGPMVKNPPVNAGDTGSIPGQKIPCAEEQVSLCMSAAEPALWSPGASTRSHCNEKPEHCNEE